MKSFVLAVSAAVAATPSPTVDHAWSRPTPPGVTVGVAYFEVANPGAADTLVSIESPLAERVEMHATSESEGMMQMRQRAEISVAAGGHLTFAPGGLHAMLIGLVHPLREGDRVPLVLVFKRAGRVNAVSSVRGVDASGNSTLPVDGGFRLTAWPAAAPVPDFELRDAEGRVRRAADFRGRVLVIFFGFVRCPDACPAELFKLSLVMKRLGASRDRVQVLFVTLDPQRDTGAALRRYVTAYDPRFIGLTGTTGEIDRAAAAFHVEYARVAQGNDYTIDHSASTFLLDARGRLRLVGTPKSGVGDLAHDLTLLAAEP